MPRYEQIQQQQQYVGSRRRRKRKKFIKWKKICKQIILSWYTFGCLIITLYLYIFQSNLFHQIFTTNIFVNFSDFLYEVIFTNQGVYALHSYIDLWMEYLNYVSFETLFQDVPLISVAYCRLYTKPFLTIGNNNQLSFFWETSGCSKQADNGWTEFCFFSKKNKIHQCCNINSTTSSSTNFLSTTSSSISFSSSSSYCNHIGTNELTSTHRSHIITLNSNLPPGDDYIYGMNMINKNTNERFQNSPAITGKKFHVPPSSLTLRNSNDNDIKNAYLKNTKKRKMKKQLLYSFIIFGDNQAGAVTFERLLQSANENDYDQASHPNLLIHLGDAVQDAYIKREWHSYFFSPLQRLPFTHQIPLLLTQGNHDVIPSRFFNINNNNNNNNNGNLRKKRYDHTYYSLSIGNAIRFVVLNSNIDDSKQRDFMLNEFQSNKFKDAEYRIILCHIAPFIEYWEPNAWFNKNEKNMGKHVREKWVPLFEQYKVDVVISGHSHVYQRGRKNDVTYIISGGAGAELEDIDNYRVANYKFYKVTIGKHHVLKLKVIGTEKKNSNTNNQIVKNKKGILLNGWIHDDVKNDDDINSGNNGNINENRKKKVRNMKLQFIAQDKTGVPIDSFTVM